MKNIPFSLLCCLCCLFGCEKEDNCEDEVQLGNFTLSAEAKAFNPFKATQKKVIFKDDMGNEHPFELSGTELVTGVELSIDGPCPQDSSKTAVYFSTLELYQIAFIGTTLPDLDFLVRLNDVPEPNNFGVSGEELIILAVSSDLPDGEETCLYHRINQSDANGKPLPHTDNTFLFDHLTLLGKPFSQVLSNTQNEYLPRFDVKYNSEFGIVGFTDTQKGIEYVFDRVE
jgi:hypothetical protein